MVVGGMVDRLRAAGCVPQLRWIGGLVIACMGGTVDGGGDGDGGGRSVFVSAANDRMDVVGLEAAELEAVARGLIEVGVRLKSGWVEHNGAMARDMVYGSSGAELGMVLDAVEDAGFAVKKRYKPHKLYQVD